MANIFGYQRDFSVVRDKPQELRFVSGDENTTLNVASCGLMEQILGVGLDLGERARFRIVCVGVEGRKEELPRECNLGSCPHPSHCK